MSSRPGPEEQARLRAVREAKRAAKRERYGAGNLAANLPVCEMRIPSQLDLQKAPWDNYLDALEWNWRTGHDPVYRGACKRKIILT